MALVISHPIQHFCPMYASWATIKGIDLKVFFGSNLGAVKYIDPNFKKEIQWNNLYLDEFNHDFLNGDKTLQSEPNSDVDALNLGEKLNDFAPDLLVLYGYTQNLSKRARKWALQNRVKIGYISDAEHRQKRPLWKEVIKLPYLYYFFKNVDYFLSVGDANEAYYRFYGVPQKKIKRMHFSIDIRSYDKAFEQKETLRNNLRNQYNIKSNEIVISVVGKLVEWKSQDHLIRLLNELEKSYPQKKFHLLIAGSGPMEEKWKVFATKVKQNEVHFLGFINPIGLPQIYAASDVYLHPAIINHYQHFHSYIRPKSVNEKTFEGVIDFNTPIDASLLKYLKKLNS